MNIDYSTNVGKLRLRCADVTDLAYLPDSVYEGVLADTNNDFTKSTVICANYILGMLAFKSHRKLQQLEVWGSEAFTNYRQFLKDTIMSPNQIAGIYPVPYSPDPQGQVNPLNQFIKDWNNSYLYPRQSQVLSLLATYNPTQMLADPKDPDYISY